MTFLRLKSRTGVFNSVEQTQSIHRSYKYDLYAPPRELFENPLGVSYVPLDKKD
jgi:hypothetical protein